MPINLLILLMSDDLIRGPKVLQQFAHFKQLVFAKISSCIGWISLYKTLGFSFFKRLKKPLFSLVFFLLVLYDETIPLQSSSRVYIKSWF